MTVNKRYTMQKKCQCLSEDYRAWCYTNGTSGCRCPVCESYAQSRKECPAHGAPRPAKQPVTNLDR